MQTEDFLITTISSNNNIYGYFCNIKNSMTEIQKKHGLNIISTTLLSRAMIATTLLSGNLKNKNDYITLIWQCSGEVKKIFAEGHFDGSIRAYIGEKNLLLIENSLKDNFIFAEPYIGFGELKVLRTTFDNRPPYSSIVPIETGEIAQDISLYLDQALQIQSALKLGFSISKENIIESAGGLLLMAMPGVTKEELTKIYESFNSIGSLTEILQKENTEINELFLTLGLEIINVKKINHRCLCNREKISNVMKSLDQDELKKFITDESKLEVECQYCSEKYSFDMEEFKK
jgi:molecular chaperone Hsp33